MKMTLLNVICLICLATLINVAEGRPQSSKCIIMKIRWSGIECKEIANKNVDEKKLMSMLANNYKSKFTALLKLKGHNGKGPIRADVRKRLLKELAKARNLLWSA